MGIDRRRGEKKGEGGRSAAPWCRAERKGCEIKKKRNKRGGLNNADRRRGRGGGKEKEKTARNIENQSITKIGICHKKKWPSLIWGKCFRGCSLMRERQRLEGATDKERI